MATMDLLALLENVASPDPRDAMDMTDNRVCLERRVNREWYRHRDPRVNLVSLDAMDKRVKRDPQDLLASAASRASVVRRVSVD